MRRSANSMSGGKEKPATGLRNELRLIGRQARQVWRLIPARPKLVLAGAALLMALTSGCSIVLPLLLGELVDEVSQGMDQHRAAADLYGRAALYLGLLGATYLVRETLQVIRRYLVENTCTRIDREMSVQVISHLLKVDLAHFT